MNILLLTEFFKPFDRGGTEWSVYYLAKALGEKNHKVIIITPNYGAPAQEQLNHFLIKRFPFPIKLRNFSATISPFLHNNPLFWIVSAVATIKVAVQYKSDVVHVQSKSLLPGAVLAKYIIRKPLLVTLRDYYYLCPYGLCINKRRNYTRCSAWFLFRHEISEYLRQYESQLSFSKIIFHLCAAINARITSKVLLFLLRFADKVICISKKEQLIYARNGVVNTELIYNIFPIRTDKHKKRKQYDFGFSGRLTPGKGFPLFIEAFKRHWEKNPRSRVAIFGEGFLKEKIEKSLGEEIKKRLVFKGHLPHQELLKQMAYCKFMVTPAIWEEPFGRTALESLGIGTPVICTNRGGLPEIIKSNSTGIIIEPKIDSLVNAMRKGLKYRKAYDTNIQKKAQSLKQFFFVRPINQHIILYEQLAYKN